MSSLVTADGHQTFLPLVLLPTCLFPYVHFLAKRYFSSSGGGPSWKGYSAMSFFCSVHVVILTAFIVILHDNSYMSNRL